MEAIFSFLNLYLGPLLLWLSDLFSQITHEVSRSREAFIGLLGVAVGSFIPWVQEALRLNKTRGEQGAYLAARIICTLEGYVDKCIEVIRDDGTIMGAAAERDKDGHDIFNPQVPLPDPPIYPSDVDWKSIDSKLMFQILKFPNAVLSANELINFVAREVAFPPDHEELFEEREEQYAALGLEALRLTDVLRRKYGFRATPSEIADWNPREVLEKKKKEVDEAKRRRAAASEELMKTMSKKVKK